VLLRRDTLTALYCRELLPQSETPEHIIPIHAYMNTASFAVTISRWRFHVVVLTPRLWRVQEVLSQYHAEKDNAAMLAVKVVENNVALLPPASSTARVFAFDAKYPVRGSVWLSGLGCGCFEKIGLKLVRSMTSSRLAARTLVTWRP
jgi:hypothetical protein